MPNPPISRDDQLWLEDAVRSAAERGFHPAGESDHERSLIAAMTIALLEASPEALERALRLGAPADLRWEGSFGDLTSPLARAQGLMDQRGRKLAGRRMMGLLLDAGADPDQEGVKATPPLARAVFRGDDATARLLLKSGANPNRVYRAGNAPAHMLGGIGIDSEIEGSWRCLKALARAGADWSLKNDEGATPIEAARASGRDALAQAMEVELARAEARELRRGINAGSRKKSARSRTRI